MTKAVIHSPAVTDASEPTTVTMSLGFDLEDCEAIFFVPIGDPLDQAREAFRKCGWFVL
jgi:hypothetical protein